MFYHGLNNFLRIFVVIYYEISLTRYLEILPFHARDLACMTSMLSEAQAHPDKLWKKMGVL